MYNELFTLIMTPAEAQPLLVKENQQRKSTKQIQRNKYEMFSVET